MSHEWIQQKLINGHVQSVWKPKTAEFINKKISYRHTFYKFFFEFVERNIPGFQSLVDFYELAPPLTFEYCSKHPEGAIYGIPLSVNRFENPWISVQTPLKGLYLTGADIAAPGIAGAMMGGVLTLSEIVGFSVFGKVFRK